VRLSHHRSGWRRHMGRAAELHGEIASTAPQKIGRTHTK
jgi:hypothetical protein